MTVDIYSGPGTEDYRSTAFSLTVNGSAAYVYQKQRTAVMACTKWDENDQVGVSFVTFGTNADATVVATRIAGAPTSVEVFPKNLAIDYTLSGATLTMTLPTRTKVCVVCNGDWTQTLWISADGLKEDINPDTLDLADYAMTTPATAASDTVTYFGPGVHNIGQLFECAPRSRVYLDGGAWVIGSFDIRGSADVVICGPGVLSGEWSSPEALHPGGVGTQVPDYAAATLYAMVLGYDGVTTTFTGCYLRNITIVNPPFHATLEGLSYAYDVKLFGPWWYNCDAFELSLDSGNNYMQVADHCVAFTGDDNCKNYDNWGRQYTRDMFGVNVAAASVLLAYWGYPRDYGTTIEDCTFVQLGLNQEGVAVFKCWVDNDTIETALGRFDLTVDGIHVEDDLACPLFEIETRDYPVAWGPPAPQGGHGQIAYHTWSNITVEGAPATRARLMGTDVISTPHDIAFDNVTFAGVELTVRNWSTFVDSNAYPYNITVGGRLMVTAVDICNLALSHIGDVAKVTAIAPADGSAQAAQCARFYPLARDAVLEMHSWGFATKRVALTLATFTDPTATSDVDAWDYAYVIPADMMRALSIIPTGASDDYSPGSVSTYVPQPYAIEMNADGDLLLYTDLEDAVLRYTAYVTDPNLFPPLFQAALSWHLASMLAGPIIKGAEGAAEAKRCQQMLAMYLQKAQGSDASQRSAKPTHVVPWISARS